ncbi:MAG: ISNCY family transposase, partial [Gammaproteobacteria bacterium]|nr:ISNCY family transposase [Gammaproteobacteria bacterium]
REMYSDLRVCSFDRGFHSPENRERLDKLLVVNALPRKGRLNKADQALESEEGFVEARRQHPAVESAINALDHRGLDRVRTHGALGFARTVALSVLASNFHQLGRLLQSSGSRRKQLRSAA